MKNKLVLSLLLLAGSVTTVPTFTRKPQNNTTSVKNADFMIKVDTLLAECEKNVQELPAVRAVFLLLIKATEESTQKLTIEEELFAELLKKMVAFIDLRLEREESTTPTTEEEVAAKKAVIDFCNTHKEQLA